MWNSFEEKQILQGITMCQMTTFIVRIYSVLSDMFYALWLDLFVPIIGCNMVNIFLVS